MKSMAKGGFLQMILAVLGVVLYVTIFSSILAAAETIRIYANIATFTALETVVEVAPTILLLGGLLGGGFVFYKGYKSSASGGTDTGGMLRMVTGALIVIVFLTLFSTILTSMYTLYTADNATEYTAFRTVVQITPTILFLTGIFAGIGTAVSGYRARKRGRARR